MDCKYADSCNMSAKTIYLEHPERWTFYVWSELMKGNEKPTLEQKEQYLRTSTPYGKCAYKSDNNVVGGIYFGRRYIICLYAMQV